MSKHIETPVELFDGVIDLIIGIVDSFNPKDFPKNTLSLISALKLFIKENSNVLNLSRRVEAQLKDSLIDLDAQLLLYLRNAQDRKTKLYESIQNADFAGAREIFKKPIREIFIPSLMPEEKGDLSPGTLWRKSFAGLMGVAK